MFENFGDRKRGYFVAHKQGKSEYYHFDTIGKEIRKNHPDLVGKHIFQQLEALGLQEVFEGSETPVSLPYSFK